MADKIESEEILVTYDDSDLVMQYMARLNGQRTYHKLSFGQLMIVLTMLFAIGSIAGWVYETLFDLIQGHGLVMRATFILPWCPIYGIGCVICELILGRWWQHSPKDTSSVLICWVTTALLVTACELAGSVILEATTGKFPWDYSAYPLNFQGRVAAPFTLLFATGATIMVCCVAPRVKRMVHDDTSLGAVIAATVVVLILIEITAQKMGIADEMRTFVATHPDLLTKNPLGRLSIQSPVG